MSARVKLAAILPGEEEVNGVDDLQGDLCANPDKLRFAIIAYRTIKVTRTVESGVETPTIAVEKFEPVGDAGNVPDAVRDAMLEAAQDRLGHQPLPFDETDPAGYNTEWADNRDDAVYDDVDV